MTVPALRVVVADDSVLLRAGIVRVLATRGFDVVAEAGTADELLVQVARHAPDVAVTDIRMPPTSTDEGLRAAAALADSHPDLGVVVLSEHLVAEYATRLLHQGVGGRGYLLKQSVGDLDVLADAVRRTASGEAVVDPSIVAQLMRRQVVDDPLERLSDRESEVLAMMAEGRSNHAIAERLVLSPRTVESHVRSVFQKLDLEDTVEDHRRVLAVMRYLQGSPA